MRDPGDPGTIELPLEQRRVGYARVWCEDQELVLQRVSLESARCTVIYEDVASGRNARRPQLMQCIEALCQGDTLVVWRLDRLGRSLSDLVHVVTSLGVAGVAFESLTEKINTRNVSCTSAFNLFTSLADFERNLSRESSLVGLAAARVRGRAGGRPKILTAEHVHEIQQLLSDRNVTVSDAAAQYNVGTATIYRYLKRADAEKKRADAETKRVSQR